MGEFEELGWGARKAFFIFIFIFFVSLLPWTVDSLRAWSVI